MNEFANLIGTAPDLYGTATFSDDTPPTFRHQLTRYWADGPHALVCMCNPSYAGAYKNDPTIRSLIRLLRPLPGVAGFDVVNWEPFIATDCPSLHAWRKTVMATAEYVGIETYNLRLIRNLSAGAAIRIIAWGNLVPDTPHTQKVLAALSLDGAHSLYTFGTTKDGAPKHPMARGKHRIADGTMPTIWRKLSGEVVLRRTQKDVVV